jgi:hypothetical protein
LVLAPALSAWGCFVAVRALVTWWPGAVVAALVYGYSAAMVTSLVFGHVSVTVLVVPPLLFWLLHEIVIRQAHSFWRDGAWLAALLVVQFLISPEILVMCGLLALIGLAATAAVGWHQVAARWGHAVRALGLGCGVAAVLLAYPAWFGLAGRQSVTGVLFVLAPFAGLPLSGVVSPGQYAAAANVYVRFGGYLGHNGPPPDYLGAGVVLAGASAVLARRRPLTWLLVFMSVVTLVLGLGDNLVNGPGALSHIWLPWLDLSKLPVFKEIIADQFAPFLPFFVGALLAVGLDELWISRHDASSWMARRAVAVTGATTAVVAALVLVPVFATFDVPLTVKSVVIPPYMRHVAPELPDGTVLLTVPFAISGTDQPMLWQAIDDLHFRLAGAALKTPNKEGGPIQRGAPGSARHILTSLSIGGSLEPQGTPDEIAAVRYALGAWQVDRVVIAGASRDPVYASGFITMALGTGPEYVDGAWVWELPRGAPTAAPVLGISLSQCRTDVAAPSAPHDPLAMARCVMFAGGRSWTTQP